MRLYPSLALLCLFLGSFLTSCHGGREIAAERSVVSSREFDAFYLASVRAGLLGDIASQSDLLLEALRMRPSSGEALYDLARLHYDAMDAFSDKKAVATAKDYALRAYRANEQDVRSMRLLADIYDKEMFYDSALVWSERVASLSDSKDDWLKVLVLGKKCNLASSVAAVKHIEKIEGVNATSAHTLLQLAIEMNDSTLMIESLHRCKPLLSLSDYYATGARVMLLLDRYKDAREWCDSLYRHDPTNLYYAPLRFEVERKDHNLTGELQQLQRIVESKTIKRTLLEHFLEATANDCQSHSDTLRLARLIGESLQRPLPQSDLGEVYLTALENLKLPSDTLLHYYQRLLTTDPENLSLRHKAFVKAIESTDTTAFKQILLGGMKYSPKELIFYHYAANNYWGKDQLKDAIDVCEQALEKADTVNITKALKTDFFSLCASIYDDAGRLEKACKMYERAVNLNPLDDATLNNYAYLLYRMNQRLVYAEQLSRCTVESAPESPYYLDTYAIILAKNHKPKEALEYMQRALLHAEDKKIELDTYWEHMAQILELLGKKKEAYEFWKLIDEKGKDEKVRLQAKEKLQTLK